MSCPAKFAPKLPAALAGLAAVAGFVPDAVARVPEAELVALKFDVPPSKPLPVASDSARVAPSPASEPPSPKAKPQVSSVGLHDEFALSAPQPRTKTKPAVSVGDSLRPAPVKAPAIAPKPQAAPRRSPPSSLPNPASKTALPESWWDRGSDSPIAIAIGHAEGTRGADGGKNPAYYWHRDPGNGADNFGTFSYQHLDGRLKAPVAAVAGTQQKRQQAASCRLPERADRLQLERLKGFYERLKAQAAAKNLDLTLEETLNGLDLANQSPAAGLNWMGYIDRLAQMKQRHSDPQQQILEARVWSYWNPYKHHWDASGLGNTYESIRRDQLRRQQAIARTLTTPRPAEPANYRAVSAEDLGDRTVVCPLSGF